MWPPGGPNGGCLHSSPKPREGDGRPGPDGCQAAAGTSFPTRGLAVGPRAGQEEPALCGMRQGRQTRAGEPPPTLVPTPGRGRVSKGVQLTLGPRRGEREAALGWK